MGDSMVASGSFLFVALNWASSARRGELRPEQFQRDDRQNRYQRP
jgi:hypothetical protein